jgi:hypothetical protein
MSEDKEQEIRRRLLVFFKNHSEMAEAYIAKFGTDINVKNIQAIRAEFPGVSDTGSMPAASETTFGAEDSPNSSEVIFRFSDKAFECPQGDPTLESPLYPRVVDCPICNKWGINSQELRAKALSVLNDPFLAPVYISPGHFQTINYLLASVTVCNGCFLASPDRKDFILYNRTTRQNQESQLKATPQVIRELKETIDKRKAFFDKTGIGDALFKIPRSYAGGIVSYQFADMRAEIEGAAKVLGAFYKRGNYWTRIALLCRQAGMDDHKPLEIAAEHFKTAFSLSDFPKIELEFQTLYILFNIYMYFENQREARDYLTVLDKTRQDLEKRDAPPEALAALKKWLGMCRARWDDRENPNFWKTPGL